MSLTWRCADCGEEHDGLPALHFDRPMPWDQLTLEEQEASNLQPDTCEIHGDEGDFYYVRGTFDIPIQGTTVELGFGVWSSLSAGNFARFIELYDDPARADEPRYPSWFGNRVPGFPDTFNLEAWVEIYDADLRPQIGLVDREHPMARAQEQGIELAQAIALAAPVIHRAEPM